jgi:hypothetical protein
MLSNLFDRSNAGYNLSATTILSGNSPVELRLQIRRQEYHRVVLV